MRHGLRAVLVAATMLFSACGQSAPSLTPGNDPELVATGARLYAASCAACHGDDLRGTDSGPSFLSDVYEPGHHGDGAFQVAVLSGVPQHHWDFGPMPPVEGLTPEDVDAIVAFVRENQ